MLAEDPRGGSKDGKAGWQIQNRRSKHRQQIMDRLTHQTLGQDKGPQVQDIWACRSNNRPSGLVNDQLYLLSHSRPQAGGKANTSESTKVKMEMRQLSLFTQHPPAPDLSGECDGDSHLVLE
ncbi:unnamed protein product [Pleuronectes platessa]|uniref:Uncharacterized protein n=1 Tax=Pleuronectes platessa TaxID=8262 RepID=A0A9N7ULH0_PLEPL|nr:unnamed protein product [Pleuronectes platessa]